MAQTSGISNGSVQTLFTGVQVSPTVFAIKVGVQLLPTEERVGYYYLYAIDGSESGRRYLIDRGAVYSPGIYCSANMVAPLGGSEYQMVVSWNFANLPWRFTLA
jgi:hypothetical protein